MEDGSQLRVGIVGCGYQGGRLVEAIRLVDSLVVTACADIQPQAAMDLAGKVGHASVHTSMDDLLAHANVDVVMVATPHDVLAPLSLKAIQAGKHVLVEKPCGMNEKELAQLEDAAASAGVCCTAGYSFRYIPAWYKVHELLEQGVVGEIQAVLGLFGFGPMNDGWASRPESGGGPLMFLGSHLIDQVLWYVQDEPVETIANIRYRHDTQADETTALQIVFAKGATAQLMVTQTMPGFMNQLDITGRAGTIHMRLCGFLDYEIVVSSSVEEAYQQPAVVQAPIHGDVRNVKHSRQLSEFVSAIRFGKPPFVTLRDGRRVMKVIDAALASDRSGVPVHMD